MASYPGISNNHYVYQNGRICMDLGGSERLASQEVHPNPSSIRRTWPHAGADKETTHRCHVGKGIEPFVDDDFDGCLDGHTLEKDVDVSCVGHHPPQEIYLQWTEGPNDGREEKQNINNQYIWTANEEMATLERMWIIDTKTKQKRATQSGKQKGQHRTGGIASSTRSKRSVSDCRTVRFARVSAADGELVDEVLHSQSTKLAHWDDHVTRFV